MALNRFRPHARVMIGRNTALTAAAFYCLTRAWGYLPHTYPQGSDAVGLVTADGTITWIWAGIWVLAGVLCVVDMARRRTRYGLSLMVGLAFAWGVAYFMSWTISGFTSRDWLTSITYLGPAVVIFGFLLKVTALQDMLNPAAQQDGEA